MQFAYFVLSRTINIIAIALQFFISEHIVQSKTGYHHHHISWNSVQRKHDFLKDWQPGPGSGHFTLQKSSPSFGLETGRKNKPLIATAALKSPHGNGDAEKKYQRISRERHNMYRKRHGAGALSASNDLNRRAIRCAQYYAKKGRIDHSCPHKNGAGENLWAYWGPNRPDESVAQSSTDAWYSEKSDHDFSKDYQRG